MKKLASLMIAIFCFCSCLMFTACKDNKAIEMSVYFDSTAEASISGESKVEQLELSKLTSSSPYETKKYTRTKIKSNSWFYGMYVETISFYIYSTETKEVEFNFVLTGVEHGIETTSSVTKDLILVQQPCALKANQGYKVTINVNDRMYLSSSNSVLTIELSDKVTEFVDNNFAYCIYGLEIIAYHK